MIQVRSLKALIINVASIWIQSINRYVSCQGGLCCPQITQITADYKMK
jgi:hypothetical protein